MGKEPTDTKGKLTISEEQLEEVFERIRKAANLCRENEGHSICINFFTMNEEDETDRDSFDGSSLVHGSLAFLCTAITQMTEDYPAVEAALTDHYMKKMMGGKDE